MVYKTWYHFVCVCINACRNKHGHILCRIYCKYHSHYLEPSLTDPAYCLGCIIINFTRSLIHLASVELKEFMFLDFVRLLKFWAWLQISQPSNSCLYWHCHAVSGRDVQIRHTSRVHPCLPIESDTVLHEPAFNKKNRKNRTLWW